MRGEIPRLLPADEARPGVGERIQAFYDEHPFPEYDEDDDPARLRERASRGRVAAALDATIAPDASVIEIGCGTGQLVNFLSLRPERVVIGADLATRPLELAEAFRARYDLGALFVQMDIFAPAIREASMDALICTGVLHHTADPRGGFHRLVRLVKPGGLVLVGLYNRYGRLTTDARRFVMRALRRPAPRLDPRLRSEHWGARRRAAWMVDQYANPHESKHTMDEVLGWFADDGVQFVASVPAIAAGDESPTVASIFAPRSSGSHRDRLAAQLAMVARSGRYGGLFLMLGRRV